MVPSSDFKQRLLREAVQVNTGQRPHISRAADKRHKSSKRRRSLLTVLVMGPILLLSAAILLTTYGIENYEFTHLLAFASKVVGKEEPPTTGPIADTSEETFPILKPIDLDVFHLAVSRIIIDAGHGGNDSGAVAPQGFLEKEVTLDIAIRLRDLLRKNAFDVIMTRDSDKTVSLNDRVGVANSNSADLFISIHANWFKDPTTRGIETYYLGATDDPHALQLAALENKASGYSMGDYRQLLETVYMNVKRSESRHLATTIQYHLARSLRPHNPTLVDRGVKRAPFVVLMSTQMPAVLAEVSFLSNREEARLLATGEYRQDIAKAMYRGIRLYANTLNQTAQKGN